MFRSPHCPRIERATLYLLVKKHLFGGSRSTFFVLSGTFPVASQSNDCVFGGLDLTTYF